MSNNNQSNRLIKWIVVAGDFVLLNAIILVGATLSWRVNNWPDRSLEIFILVNNIAMILAMTKFSTIIHQRMIGAGDVLQRLVGLTMVQSIAAYVLLKVFDYYLPIGWIQFWVGTAFFGSLLVKRLCERWFIKLYRQAGRNTRTATLVGNDPELMNLYEKLTTDMTMGYRILGYYADTEMGEWTWSMEEGREGFMVNGSGFMVQDGSEKMEEGREGGMVHGSGFMVQDGSEKMEEGREGFMVNGSGFMVQDGSEKMEEGRWKKEDGRGNLQTSDIRLQTSALSPQTSALSPHPSALTPHPSALRHLGTLQEFLRMIKEEPEKLELGDEMYVSLSRRDRDVIKRISRFCDNRVIRFFYVPTSVESIGLNLKRELLDDMELFTTYETPLQNPMNKLTKRCMDIILSILFLIPTAIIFPFVWIIVKIQSPGPLFFKQDRTGLDGKNFKMIKFRSMHVNKDADKIQATKDDPRKYPFGNFMRKANIDELPQFWNVLMGDMSIVGPRPHMLAHTEMYSQLIDKYMVRHFVKPGITGWAQVTGFRGETKELWQMEGRVKRDIWYMENWTVWLDFRIIWLTFKTFFVHDKNAY